VSYGYIQSEAFDGEMADTDPTGSRKWYVDREKLFLDLLVLSEFKPICGDSDGVMERKDGARWVLLLARLQAAKEQVVACLLESGGKRLKVDCDVGILKRKWAAFKEVQEGVLGGTRKPARQVQLQKTCQPLHKPPSSREVKIGRCLPHSMPPSARSSVCGMTRGHSLSARSSL
jgi:hypothetical protein